MRHSIIRKLMLIAIVVPAPAALGCAAATTTPADRDPAESGDFDADRDTADDGDPDFDGQGDESWDVEEIEEGSRVDEDDGAADAADVDETPCGVEDGGDIYYHSIWSDGDGFIVPAHSQCLNQQYQGDCSDTVNAGVHGVFHMNMLTDQNAFNLAAGFVREHRVPPVSEPGN